MDSSPSIGRRSLQRHRVAGRTDEMFNVRGVNVFPSAVPRTDEKTAVIERE